VCQGRARGPLQAAGARREIKQSQDKRKLAQLKVVEIQRGKWAAKKKEREMEQKQREKWKACMAKRPETFTTMILYILICVQIFILPFCLKKVFILPFFAQKVFIHRKKRSKVFIHHEKTEKYVRYLPKTGMYAHNAVPLLSFRGDPWKS